MGCNDGLSDDEKCPKGAKIKMSVDLDGRRSGHDPYIRDCLLKH